jgi:hypothetical protein
MQKCAKKALDIYLKLTAYQGFARRKHEDNFWLDTIRSIQMQWGLAKNLTQATGAFISPSLAIPAIDDNKAAEELEGAHAKK